MYCSITGYGQDAPMLALPDYDPVFQAISGIMSTCGLPDGVPGAGDMRAMVPIVDVMTGVVSTTAVPGALLYVTLAATVRLGQTHLSAGADFGRTRAAARASDVPAGNRWGCSKKE